MTEIVAAFIGALVGAGLSCLFSLWQRNSDKWKSFQEDVGTIRSRFLAVEAKDGIEGVAIAHKGSVNELTAAVCRVRHYIWRKARRKRLILLLDDYRAADQRKDSGFVPADLAGHYKGRAEDCFADPKRAIAYVVELLDEMTNL